MIVLTVKDSGAAGSSTPEGTTLVWLGGPGRPGAVPPELVVFVPVSTGSGTSGSVGSGREEHTEGRTQALDLLADDDATPALKIPPRSKVESAATFIAPRKDVLEKRGRGNGKGRRGRIRFRFI